MTSAFELTAKRGDAEIFDNITVKNWSAQTEDDEIVLDQHGNIVWDEPVVEEVPGEVTYRGEPSFARRADGIDKDTSAIAWVSDNVTITTGKDDRATRATRIEADATTYVVRELFTERNSRIRAHLKDDED